MKEVADGPATGASTAAAAADTVLWGRSIAWLLFLGPFFFATYGTANHFAASRGVEASWVFDWERHVPFVPWTIVPYWSIDLLYGLSFLLCRNRLAVDRHALRLLTAQLVSVVCFLLVPLRFSFERPAVDGLFGLLFDALTGFDQPYNQAPSLHISLLVIIWMRFSAGTRGFARIAVDAWALLIGVSVLTTYQHHFIDVPTGLLVGFLCLWLWPDSGSSPLAGWRLADSPARRRLARRYLAGALFAAATAAALGGLGWLLLWPAISLALVALNYAALGPEGFQKRDGRLSLASRTLLAPYLAAAWLNSRWWTRRRPGPDKVVDDVFLSRLPTAREMQGFAALYDLTAELEAPAGPWAYRGRPTLDLIPASPGSLRAAARDIEDLRRHGRVLVSCALGYSRSAAAVAAWLLDTGRAAGVADAAALVAARRPGTVLGSAHLDALRAAFGDRDD